MKNEVNFADRVMSEIKERNIKMRPRIYFQALSITTKAVIVVLSLAAIYFLNVSVFKFRIYAPFEFLSLGNLGLRATLGSIPWPMMFNAVFFAGAVMFILKKFHILYKRQFSQLALGMMLLVLVGGALVDQTGVNDKLKRQGNFPDIYYGQYTSDFWAMGEIEEVDNSKKRILIITPVQEKIVIAWDELTDVPAEAFKPGQYIKAVGKKGQDLFMATGIIQSSIRDLE